MTRPGGREVDIARGSGLAATSVASVQFGAALAARLFPLVGPLGAVALRLLGASVVLVLIARPWRFRWTRRELGVVGVFGAVLVWMNTGLYLAIDRLPLATVVTIEFLGPLGVAVGTARSWRERGWALPAAAGVALLGGHLLDGAAAGNQEVLGLAAALAAAGGWASYILLSRRIGRQGSGLAGLSLASVTGALIMVPIGSVAAGPALWRPGALALGATVGVLSSALPYSFDLLALRRLPTAVFGVLTSLNPAVAALAGWLILAERLPVAELTGIALVMLASAGVTLSATRRPDSDRDRHGPGRRRALPTYPAAR